MPKPPVPQPRKPPTIQQPRPNLGSVAGQQSILDESIMPKPPQQPRAPAAVQQPTLPKFALDENGANGHAKERRQPGIPRELMQLHNPALTSTSDLLGAIVRPSMGAKQVEDQDDII